MEISIKKEPKQKQFKFTARHKQKYNQMLYTLTKIAKLYQTPQELRKESERQYGLDYEEALEMSYENIQGEAKVAIRNIKTI